SAELISLELHPNRMRQTFDALPQVMDPSRQGLSSAPPAANLTQLTQELAQRPRSRTFVPAILAAAAIVVVLGVGAYVVRARAGRFSEGQAVDSAAPTAAGAANATLALVVKYPDGARLKLDGGYVDGHPFSARVPRDGSIHKLDVEQDGFTTAS